MIKLEDLDQHLQEPRQKPTDRDHPKVGHHAGSERYGVGHQQSRYDHLPSTQRIREESPQMRTRDRSRQRHRTKNSFLTGRELQIALGHGDHVADAQHLKHDRGQYRSGDRDQRVVEATKFC